MSNAIVLVTGASIELSEIDQMILAEKGADSRAFETIPTKITIAPGGINVFATSDGETMKELSCVVAVSQIARAYWPDSGSKRPPLCSSPDGVTGYLNNEPEHEQVKAASGAANPHMAIRLSDAGRAVPETYSCTECSLSKWGSAHQGARNGGKSQACKEIRRLVILVDGWSQPALLTLPPTSIKAWDTFCSVQERNRSAYWAVRAVFKLEKQQTPSGDAYSTVAVTAAAKLTDKTILQAVIALRNEYASLVREMPITSDEYRTVDDAEKYTTVDGEATAVEAAEAEPFM